MNAIRYINTMMVSRVPDWMWLPMEYITIVTIATINIVINTDISNHDTEFDFVEDIGVGPGKLVADIICLFLYFLISKKYVFFLLVSHYHHTHFSACPILDAGRVITV